MLLNRVFIGMFFISVIMAFAKLLFWGDVEIFEKLVNALFESAKLAFELAIYLTGALCFWLGVMEVGEKGGAVKGLSRIVSPLFQKLFPEVPKDHPAVGSIMMNFSANMLGLDNAATPLGLKAMEELQELNPEKEKATNAQIMFLMLNTSGLTIVPVSILAYRASHDAASPSEVFIPILLATFFATLIGLVYVAIRQKINLLNKVVLLYIGGLTALIVSLLFLVTSNPDYAQLVSKVGGNALLLIIILLFFGLAIRKKINVYECFIEGAKGGFKVAIKVIPYLVAILCAIAIFRASGALDDLLQLIKSGLLYAGVTTLEFIDALPVAFMKPFSGSGARGLMVEAFNTYGVDSFVGKLAATFQGSTETTFYVLAVYFGSVNIRKTRYAASAGLIADFAGIVAAILIAYIFYTNV